LEGEEAGRGGERGSKKCLQWRRWVALKTQHTEGSWGRTLLKGEGESEGESKGEGEGES